MTEATPEQISQWQMRIIDSVFKDIKAEVEAELYESASSNANWIQNMIREWKEGNIDPPSAEDIESLLREG